MRVLIALLNLAAFWLAVAVLAGGYALVEISRF